MPVGWSLALVLARCRQTWASPAPAGSARPLPCSCPSQAAGKPRRWAQSSSWLHEPQRHAVRLADRLHRRVFAGRAGEIGRQAMHVDVLGVLRVRVDLRYAAEAEAALETQRDQVVL